jgi:hypothetical protein
MRSRAAVTRALLSGAGVAVAVVLAIFFGSRRFRDFDTALVPYAGAAVFSAFGLGYRYSMWLSRPPTKKYWRRGWQLFLAPRRLPGNLVRLVRVVWDNIVAQRFIERRSLFRWSAHVCISWGCILAALVTFPLSFGWIRFESAGTQAEYRAFVFGVPLFRFPIDGWIAALTFNILDIAAVLVIVGVGLAMWRRARDRGALAVQQLSNDLWPLLLLFAISVTGILLTVSTHYLRGFHYTFLSQLHAVTVIFTLVYLPFGKFFHIFQRPAQLSLAFYREAGARGEPARCASCGEAFASALHVGDLKEVERELAVRYQLPGGAHYQDVCPACRRKALALSQGALWRRAGGG